jgi:hypothetical protein
MDIQQNCCPICLSDNTYSFEHIYENIQANNLSELFVHKKVKFKSERDKSRFKEVILDRTLPPPKPTLGYFELFISVFGGIFGMGVGLVCNDLLKSFFGNHFQWLILIFALFGYFKTLQLSYHYNLNKKKMKWSEKIRKWQDSWICLRCGNDW